jgi:hypothetical protein
MTRRSVGNVVRGVVAVLGPDGRPRRGVGTARRRGRLATHRGGRAARGVAGRVRALHDAVGMCAFAAGDAGAVGGLFDFACDGFGDALVEDGGDDVFGV